MKKLLIFFVVFFSVVFTAQAATFSLVQTQKASETTGTGTYTTSAFGSAITVGNTLVAVVSSDGNVSPEVTNVTDAKGNTFTKSLNKVSTASEISIWTAPITTGGTGDTVTVTYNAANSNNSGVIIQEWNAGGSTLQLDKSASGTATSASLNSGTTAATTNANELVFGSFVWTGTTAATTTAFGGGYSNGTSTLVANANLLIESKEVAATGTQVATATISASRAYAGVIATYFVSSSVPVAGPANTSTILVVKGPLVVKGAFIIK